METQIKNDPKKFQSNDSPWLPRARPEAIIIFVGIVVLVTATIYYARLGHTVEFKEEQVMSNSDNLWFAGRAKASLVPPPQPSLEATKPTPTLLPEKIDPRLKQREEDRFNAIRANLAIQLNGQSKLTNVSLKTPKKANSVQGNDDEFMDLEDVPLPDNEADKFYLNSQMQKPRSPYEVKSGAFIPAILDTGINSDLPGMVVAHTSKPVYDSVTGQYLLIPVGSKIVGQYQNNVNFGQDRLLVVWNRLIFPNGNSLDIGKMNGVDTEGYSGLNDSVNNHYFQLYGNAVLLSLISSGTQLSQPKHNSYDPERDISETLGASLGQNLGQLSVDLTRKHMNVSPTIEIRPGSEFNILVSKDMVFPKPYQ